MSYRNDEEALRAEIAVLRRENAEYEKLLTSGDEDRELQTLRYRIEKLQEQLQMQKDQLDKQLCNRCTHAIRIENGLIQCPDPGCTGVILPSRQCSVCQEDGVYFEQLKQENERLKSAVRRMQANATARTGATAEDRDPGARIPCFDGSCTGVIGVDGRCGTCGRLTVS